MNKNNNIEELFKSKLDSFETPVNDAMWSNISNSIGSSSAGASSLASKLFSTTGVAITTGLVSTVITVLIMSSGNNTEKQNLDKEDLIEQAATLETKEVTGDVVINDDELAVNNIVNYTNSESNTSKDKVEKENFIVIPTVNNDSENSSNQKAPNSAVSFFLTPPNRKYLESKNTTDSEQTSEKEASNESEKEITIIEIEKDELIATIIASPVGGYAPLDVYFSNPATRGSVHWDFGDETSSDETSPSHTFEKYGKYTVELTIVDENGSTKKDFRVIEVLANSAITEIPNVFTPNGDGVNDLWAVKGKNIEIFQMKVFNRSGNVIFTSESIDRSWDGKDKFGQDITTGTYFYFVSARGVDGKVYEHTGPITLSR